MLKKSLARFVGEQGRNQSYFVIENYLSALGLSAFGFEGF